VKDQHRRAYSHLETDVELTARIRAKFPGATRWSNDDCDQFAKRLGFQRQLVWVDG